MSSESLGNGVRSSSSMSCSDTLLSVVEEDSEITLTLSSASSGL